MIIIRKAKKGDGKGIADSFNEGLKRGFNTYTASNELSDRDKIHKMNKAFLENKKEECTFIAFDKDKRKIVGNCMFKGKSKGRTRHVVVLGWMVHPDYAGKGIGTKMVRATLAEAKKRGFKRAEAEIAVENILSLKLAKSCGFKIEGKKKDDLLLDDGRYVDVYAVGKVLR